MLQIPASPLYQRQKKTLFNTITPDKLFKRNNIIKIDEFFEKEKISQFDMQVKKRIDFSRKSPKKKNLSNFLNVEKI